MNAARHKQMVGQNLRLVREALGWSQQQMADQFGLGDKSKVSNWERGINYPDPYIIYRLQQEHGVTAADWIYLSVRRQLPAFVEASLPKAAAG